MSSNAKQVTTKLAALAKLRQQKDEQRRQMEAEAKANWLEEERLEQELEQMRLAEEERRKREAAAAAEEAKRQAEQAARDLAEFKRRGRESIEAINQKALLLVDSGGCEIATCFYQVKSHSDQTGHQILCMTQYVTLSH